MGLTRRVRCECGGLLNLTGAVLPSMRKRHSGLVLNLGSIGGFAAWRGWGIYRATPLTN
ncbi:SDR family NAD(P)-dependent oxidoreductase [Nitrospira sp. Nam74]